jgi:hypothetical protein
LYFEERFCYLAIAHGQLTKRKARFSAITATVPPVAK